MNPQHARLARLFLGLVGCGTALGQTSAPGRNPGLADPQPPLKISAHVPLVKVADFKMREARFAPAAVTDGRYIYIIGGDDGRQHTLSSIERFDPRTGTSEEFAHLGKGRLWHQAVVHAGKIYVLGGSREGGLPMSRPDFHDPLRAPYEEQARARMNEDPDLVVEEQVMDLEKSMEVVDLASRRVSEGPAMPDARNQFGCVTLGDELYVLGGRREHFDRRGVTNTVNIYSFSSGKWRAGIPMPTPRVTSAVLVDGPFIVVPGGYDGKVTKDVVEAFNPREKTWIILPPLGEHVSAHSLAFLGHSLFLFGNYAAPDELVAYDLVTKTSETFNLQYQAARHTAAVVLEGKIYVVGGKVSRNASPVDYIQVFALPPKLASTP